MNPRIESALGEKSYPTLTAACAAVPEIRLADVFRAPVHVPPIVDEVIQLKIPCLWLQEGVIHPEAARRAEAAGVRVVMDRCMTNARMNQGWE